MNFKTTYILFGTLVVLLAIAAFSLLTGPKPGEEGLLLVGFKNAGIQAKDVSRIAVDRKLPTESRMVFVRLDKDRWRLEEPYPGRVDSMQVENIVRDLLEARKETKDVELSSNLSQLGLDQPALTVTLTAGERVAVVNFGKLSFGAADKVVVYVTSSDNPKPAAIRRSTLSGLLKENPSAQTAGDMCRTVSDYRPRDLILERTTAPINVVKAVRIKGEKTEIVVNKTSDGKWLYEKPAGFGDADAEGDTSLGAGGDTTPTGVRPLLDAITHIQAGSGDDYIENVSDFAQYGLATGKEAGGKIEIVRDNPAGSDSPAITETLSIGKKDEKGDRIFVRPGDETVVVRVPATALEPIAKLLAKPDNLRDRNLLNVAASLADGVDVQVGADAPIELRKIGDPPNWRVFSTDGSSAIANTQSVTSLLNAIGARRSVKEFPEKGTPDAKLGFDHPSAVLTLWVGGVLPEEKKDDKEPKDDKAKAPDKAGEKKDEKKDEKKGPPKPKMREPTAKLIFGKVDKDLLYVRRVVGGVTTDLAVSESLLSAVRHGRLDYLDPTLPSFVVEQAVKLTLATGAEPLVVEKQKKDDQAPETWVILQPSNLAGRRADKFHVDRLLGDLAGLKAERLWAEKATDKELERFGLKPPKISVTVTLKEGDNKERTYLFGNESDDKSTVYAKQGERDLIFAARKSVADALQHADLVDPTVFTLDLSKVRGMKLTGWKEFSVNGQPQTLDLERKAANDWAIKGSGNYKLSSSAAESFLIGLQSVRAEKMIVYKTGLKPEHKLTADAGALLVEVTIEGEKDPVTLAIGGDAEGKSYFASSNKLPGDVFLLPKDRFEKYKTKPNAFAAE